MILSPKIFLEELIKINVISPKQAEKYESESINHGLPIDQYLIKEAKISKDTVLKIKAKLLNTEYVDVTRTPVELAALQLIPHHLAKTHKVLPYHFDQQRSTIYLATADPLNLNLMDFFQAKTQKKIILALAAEGDILQAIDFVYARLTPQQPVTTKPQELQRTIPAISQKTSETTPLLKIITPEVSAAIKDIDEMATSQQEKIETNAESAPIAKIVSTILEYAVKSRASDIHIEPEELKTRVRYRIDGVLREVLTLPKSIHESLTARIKILSALKIDEKRIPQDGRFTFKTDKDEVDLRVSTLPIVFGEKIVLRLLKKSGGIPTLTELGLQGGQLRDIEEQIRRPYGIILVTGPTGSGKSTTLYSILNKLNSPAINIVTLEDPVEYQIPGINQVQINPQAGLTFATGLRAFLRQDPNIILVGEIRDKETTQLAIQAALTGHLVFATLHTNDAATTIPRLIDLGGEPFLIASVLLASLAQRIVRRVCNHCKMWYEPTLEIQNEIRQTLGNLLPKQYISQSIKIAKGTGCSECAQTGYFGRIGVFEVLKVSSTINTMILQSKTAEEIEAKAKEEGFITRRQDGYLKVLEGKTTIEEVLRVSE